MLTLCPTIVNAQAYNTVEDRLTALTTLIQLNSTKYKAEEDDLTIREDADGTLLPSMLKGKVVSIRVWIHDWKYKFGELTADKVTRNSYVYYFDRLGNVVHAALIDWQGENYMHYSYDEQNRIVKKVSSSVESWNDAERKHYILGEYSYIYDSKGIKEINIMSASRNEPLNLDSKHKFNYSNGIKSCIIYNGDGSEYKRYQCLNVGAQPISSKESITTLNYYKNGRLVLTKNIFNKASKINRLEDSFSYNASGVIIKRVRKYYDASESVISTQEIYYSYQYDSVGNWISCFVTVESEGKKHYSIKREIKYAQKDGDYDYLDPEYAEDIRNKQIADSIKIVEESARKEAERIAEIERIKQHKADSISAVEYARKEAERNERIEKTNVFSDNMLKTHSWKIVGVIKKVDIGNDGTVDFRINGINPSKYILVKEEASRIAINNWGITAFDCYKAENMDYYIYKSHLFINAHSKECEVYTISNKVIQKLNETMK